MGESITEEKREVGRRLKSARARAGLQQQDVLRALKGLFHKGEEPHRMTISRWERGASRVPEVARAPLAKLYKVQESDIWHDAPVGVSRETPPHQVSSAPPAELPSPDYARGLLDAALHHNATVAGLLRQVRDGLSTMVAAPVPPGAAHARLWRDVAPRRGQAKEAAR